MCFFQNPNMQYEDIDYDFILDHLDIKEGKYRFLYSIIIITYEKR